MTPKCRYDTTHGWLLPEHLRDCNDTECAGCKPCGKSHCGMRDRCGNHVQQHAGIYTCPSCIGKTRRQVQLIATRYAELPDEYEYAGVDSEVLNLHGPAASPEQYAERRKRLMAEYGERGWCDFPKHNLVAADPHHPYAVLGRWDIAIRESYNQPTDLFVTVSRAVDYLAGDILNTFAHTQEFEDFARDVAACLSHLEDVLALSQRPEQGAPCPTCRETQQARRLVKRYGSAIDGSEDMWVCQDNQAHEWTDKAYRARVDGDYVKHATELPAAELAERIGVALSTFRKWTAKSWNPEARRYDDPRLVSHRKGADGRKLYSVADALRLAEGVAA